MTAILLETTVEEPKRSICSITLVVQQPVLNLSYRRLAWGHLVLKPPPNPQKSGQPACRPAAKPIFKSLHCANIFRE
jgi:hypothetical protein